MLLLIFCTKIFTIVKVFLSSEVPCCYESLDMQMKLSMVCLRLSA